MQTGGGTGGPAWQLKEQHARRERKAHLARTALLRALQVPQQLHNVLLDPKIPRRAQRVEQHLLALRRGGKTRGGAAVGARGGASRSLIGARACAG